jgi:plasmid stability protein
MPNISVKDVPEAWAEALRQRAARNHRSLQDELMALIQCAVEPESAASAKQTSAQRRSTVVGFDRFGNPILRQGWKTVEQVVAELKAKYPDGPVAGQGSSIDMIREDRDSR